MRSVHLIYTIFISSMLLGLTTYADENWEIELEKYKRSLQSMSSKRLLAEAAFNATKFRATCAVGGVVITVNAVAESVPFLSMLDSILVTLTESVNNNFGHFTPKNINNPLGYHFAQTILGGAAVGIVTVPARYLETGSAKDAKESLVGAYVNTAVLEKHLFSESSLCAKLAEKSVAIDQVRGAQQMSKEVSNTKIAKVNSTKEHVESRIEALSVQAK